MTDVDQCREAFTDWVDKRPGTSVRERAFMHEAWAAAWFKKGAEVEGGQFLDRNALRLQKAKVAVLEAERDARETVAVLGFKYGLDVTRERNAMRAALIEVLPLIECEDDLPKDVSAALQLDHPNTRRVAKLGRAALKDRR